MVIQVKYTIPICSCFALKSLHGFDKILLETTNDGTICFTDGLTQTPAQTSMETAFFLNIGL